MKRLLPSATVVVGLVALGLLPAACSSHPSGPGVATIAAASATPSASTSGQPSMIAYAQCMRSHGVPDYPDPDSQGRTEIKMQPGSDLDPNSATFKAAQSACKSLQPVPNASQQAQDTAAMLKYAQCMRSHGVLDFPDPSANGGLQIQVKPGSDLDPNSPQFQAAQQACQSLMPGGGSGQSLDSGGGGS